ncbi:MAG: KpsF/GutQ family sugar-phosphate isomerase [Gammaproteobacteria bacterium]|nr:KpsF/GutQ family sugar-phosphate isomerase [Gammaproteobacteria bacterium]
MNPLIVRAGEMLDRYGAAMAAARDLLDERFAQAVELIAGLDSILIVTGLGKSGHVANKVAATLSSTGTQATFVHPVEALHGDLGIVRPGSALLALSKSGSNEETIALARQFKAVAGGQVISLTEPNSKLAAIADIALEIPALPEIDEFDLAPTTSAVTTMAVCDVLAILVQQAKGLTERDFARFHPSGTLGKRLLLSVADVMIKGDGLPVVDTASHVSDLFYEISSKGIGMTTVVDDAGLYVGVVTDADIRRLLLRGEHINRLSVAECFERSRRGSESSAPREVDGSASPDTKAIECLRQMQANQITELVILEGERPVGVVRLQDLIAAGF